MVKFWNKLRARGYNENTLPVHPLTLLWNAMSFTLLALILFLSFDPSFVLLEVFGWPLVIHLWISLTMIATVFLTVFELLLNRQCIYIFATIIAMFWTFAAASFAVAGWIFSPILALVVVAGYAYVALASKLNTKDKI